MKQRVERPTIERTDDQMLQMAVAQAIGNRVKAERRRLAVTLEDAAEAAGLSMAMLSRIENARAVPSMRTLTRLSRALTIPMTEFFRGLEDDREATLVKAGQGVKVTDPNRARGHQYEILAPASPRRAEVEPWLIHLPDPEETFPFFQHEGIGFVFMLEGTLVYRCGSQAFEMEPGDALLYDLMIPHRPEMLDVPVRYLHVSFATGGTGRESARRTAEEDTHAAAPRLAVPGLGITARRHGDLKPHLDGPG